MPQYSQGTRQSVEIPKFNFIHQIRSFSSIFPSEEVQQHTMNGTNYSLSKEMQWWRHKKAVKNYHQILCRSWVCIKECKHSLTDCSGWVTTWSVTRTENEPSRRSKFYNHGEGPYLVPSSGLKLSHLRHYEVALLNRCLTHGNVMFNGDLKHNVLIDF